MSAGTLPGQIHVPHAPGFCATSWELEGERRAFYDVVGQFNETDAMPARVLYVPVSLTNIHDKRAYQYTVEENIRDCRHYILAVSEDWGPRERNFERDYRLAVECRADPSLPLRQTAILVRNQPDGAASPFIATLAATGFSSIAFSGIDDFQHAIRGLLTAWLPEDAAGPGCLHTASRRARRRSVSAPLITQTIAIELGANHWPEAIRDLAGPAVCEPPTHSKSTFPDGEAASSLLDAEAAGWLFFVSLPDEIHLVEITGDERASQGVGSAAIAKVLSLAAAAGNRCG